MERDLQKDLDLCNAATMGPWQWDVNKKCRTVHLGNHKWVVMDFVRWGMNSAQPRFSYEGLLEKSSDLAIERKAHHVGFDMDIVNPDAQFIAQAREGWQHAIERAIQAEERVKLLEKALDDAIRLVKVSDIDWHIEHDWALERVRTVLTNTKAVE